MPCPHPNPRFRLLYEDGSINRDAIEAAAKCRAENAKKLQNYLGEADELRLAGEWFGHIAEAQYNVCLSERLYGAPSLTYERPPYLDDEPSEAEAQASIAGASALTVS